MVMRLIRSHQLSAIVVGMSVWCCSNAAPALPLCRPEEDAGIWKNSSRALDHPYYPFLKSYYESIPLSAVFSVYADSHAPKAIQGLEFIRPNCRNLDPWKNDADARLVTGKVLYLFGDSLVRQLYHPLHALTRRIPAFTVHFENVYCLSPLLTDAQLDRVFARALYRENTTQESVMLINLGIHYNVIPCTLEQWDHDDVSCGISSWVNALSWDDNVQPMKQPLCRRADPTRLALDVTRLLQWIKLRRSRLPQKVLWIQTTPQHSRSFTYVATDKRVSRPTSKQGPLLDTNHIDDAYVSEHKLMTWRNDITDGIVARFRNDVRMVATQHILISRPESHVNRSWYQKDNHQIPAVKPYLDQSHYAIDSAAWLEHVNHVITSIVSIHTNNN
eukprot:m.156768 g.156768  ORF g.156768 m.156768 type:complete len:388 (+) comp31023_c0_seq2:185-1348(+)